VEEKTLGQLFIQRAKAFQGRQRFIAYIDGSWKNISWDEYYQAAREIGLGLRSLGVGKGDRVCLLSNSRLEWVYCDVGIFCLGAIPVPIYATLTADQSAYIINHCEAAVLFVENLEGLEKVRQTWGQLGHLKHVVVIEGLRDNEGEREMSLEALRRRGREYVAGHETEFEEMALAIRPEDPFTIIYTSGTTGVPKGVLTTHANYMAMIEMVLHVAPLEDDDFDLLILPLAHAYARLEHLAGIAAGFVTAFARSLTTVVEDLQVVRPTMFFSVPRIYEKAYAKILSKAEAGSPLKKKIFYWSLGVGRQVSRCHQAKRPVPPLLRAKYAIAQRLVFGKVKEVFGGRMRFAVSGASAISREILEFFHACGLVILEGYGMTETSTCSHLNAFLDYRFGTVGRPLPGVEQRIAEDGEVLVRGPNIMREYYKMPEESAETLQDGWLHTGDIGVIDADGYLKLTDRKKALFKTSGGKYVAPSPIENALRADPRISQALVVGDRRKYCVALFTLNKDELLQWAKDRGLPTEDWNALVHSPEVTSAIQELIDRANRPLASFETIKKFAILEDDFTIEGGELTPTLKVKRKVVETHYAKVLDSLYDEVYA
jgi:long-chain acyl-CoA synthetase